MQNTTGMKTLPPATPGTGGGGSMRRVLPSLLLGCLLLLCGHALAQQEGATLTATRGDGDSAIVAWTPYDGGDFEYYRVIVCDDTQYDDSSCSGTVFRSDAIYDVNDTGPVKVAGLYADTGYGVILQVWRTGGVLKLHATLPVLVTLPPTPVTVTATRSDGGDSATVAWTPYDGGDFEYYRVIVCDDTQYDGSSCSGTVFRSDAIYDVNDTGPVKVAGLDVGTGYGVILQVWRRTGGALKLHATLPPLATPPAAPTGLTAAAGIGSITLSWNDPDDSTITGYEYQLNHTATSTGNLSGWGDWIAIPDSGASTTAYTLTGLESGEEYRFHVRAVNAGGAGTAAPNAHPWYVAATPQTPPAPTGITVDVDLNVMTVGWNAVTGADGYDVRTRMDGGDWVVAASAVTATGAPIGWWWRRRSTSPSWKYRTTPASGRGPATPPARGRTSLACRRRTSSTRRPATRARKRRAGRRRTRWPRPPTSRSKGGTGVRVPPYTARIT